jgi:hypothetical protein
VIWKLGLLMARSDAHTEEEAEVRDVQVCEELSGIQQRPKGGGVVSSSLYCFVIARGEFIFFPALVVQW